MFVPSASYPRQPAAKCTAILIFVLAVYALAASALSVQRLKCDKSEVLFLGKCFCSPGYERKDPSSVTCDVPLLRIGDCECESNRLSSVDRDAFLLDPKWAHPKGYRCTALCRYTSEMGVVTSIEQEWNENQKWRQLSFYRKELTMTSLRKTYTHMQQRLDEFADGFERFGALNGTNLGHVIEFGAGGYTQTRNILEHSDATLESVTLVDPQIFDYRSIAASSFASGKLVVPARQAMATASSASSSSSLPPPGYPTVLSNLTVEEFSRHLGGKQYDTVVMMNVLVYARNALEFLSSLHASLKVGGTLIFHDRWFADSVTSSQCKTAGFSIHIIQVRKPLLDHFLSHYSAGPLLSSRQTAGQLDRSKNWCKWKDDEMGYWAIVRKER
jgi:hypothetical protein